MEDDVPVLHRELFEDVATRSRADGRPWLPTPVEHSTYKVKAEPSDSAAIFTVADRATDEPLGSALVWGLDLHNRFAHLGIALVPAARGRGMGRETLGLLCDYGFRVRGLHRLQLETLADNHAMIRTAEAAGFSHEGTLRQAAWVDGAMVDEVIFGLLAAEWLRGSPRGAAPGTAAAPARPE